MHAQEVRRCVSGTDQRALLPHLAPFVKFLAGLLVERNFSILLTTLQIVDDLVARIDGGAEGP